MIASKGAHLVSITRVRKTFAPDLLAELREALLFVLADHVECALIEIEHLPRLDLDWRETQRARRVDLQGCHGEGAADQGHMRA